MPVRRSLINLVAGARYVATLTDRHRTLKGCARAVAQELEANAGNADLFTRHLTARQVQNLVDLSAWDQNRVGLHPLKSSDAALWHDLEAMQDRLTETKAHGIAPRDGDAMRTLAERLREGAGLYSSGQN
jgi:hypothetical protein